MLTDLTSDTEAERRKGESDLVERARSGSRSAFGQLYERYRSLVHGILLSHVCFSDSEDLMQDVFVAAMARISHLRDPGAFGGWLLTITRNMAIDHRRKAIHAVPMDEQVADKNSARGEKARGGTTSAEVLEAIKALPDSYRETLILRLVEGMTGPEIAQRTGLRPESVRVNLCRGMKLLRERLQ